ncbi:hypothetical protein E2C01_016090 [Portunus trituberculatus]|uniref:Uncharacterized protein n=1 Tax=Portunus trituberculatus TaxID=210409 RepID=A0A5B7DPT9_PORTR|nr:hypothetical protein [Portunus trituberculatus]
MQHSVDLFARGFPGIFGHNPFVTRVFPPNPVLQRRAAAAWVACLPDASSLCVPKRRLIVVHAVCSSTPLTSSEACLLPYSM